MPDLPPYIQQLIVWLTTLGPLAWFALVGCSVLGAVCLVPMTLFSIAAGFMFGLWKGWLAILLACLITLWVVWIVARRPLRRWVESKLEESPKLKAVDEALGKEGIRVVTLLRIAPILPFGFANILFSVGNYRLSAYLIASLIGVMPGTLFTTYLGYLAREGLSAESASSWQWGLRILTLFALGACVFVIGSITRRALAKYGLETQKQSGLTEPHISSEAGKPSEP